MWIENTIFKEDMDIVAEASFIPWEKLRNKTILITGATGLIGFNLISALSYVNIYRNIPMKILAYVRDEEKARDRFKKIIKAKGPLNFVVGDLLNIPEIKGNVDYIIHGGSPTASRFFVDNPVETIQINLHSGVHLLNMAKEKQSDGFIFLSSMEVYGALNRQEKVGELHESFIDTMVPRNSYPEAKRMVENLCASYASEYNVPAKVIRLTQTFGPGVKKNDNRVFAQFMRSAMENEDIVLHTKGGTKHSYLYTADAVTAILSVMLNGKVGEAYNAANEETYCSIREMADTVANLEFMKEKNNRRIEVKVEENAINNSIYPPELYMDLDTKKIRNLGWKSTRNLHEMFERMMKSV